MRDKEKKYFGDPKAGGDFDDASFVIGENDWVNMQDLRTGTTDAGKIGGVGYVGGTKLLSTVYPSGTFLGIGSAEDQERNRFCYFKYNTTTSNHFISCYDVEASAEYVVVLSSQITGGLNFDKNYLIHSAYIINGLLYWTDNLNMQRRINIDAGIKLNNPTYVTDESPYSLPIAQEVIALIRKPPGLSLDVSKQFTVTPTSFNYAADFSGQFAWRFIFRDFEESVLSEPSELIRYNAPADTFNSINIIAPILEKIQQDVQQVDFCYRVGNSGVFFVLRSWNKDIAADAVAIAAHNAGVSLSYLFFNNVAGVALDLAYSIKGFDSVPRLSETIAPAENRLFLGNNLVGYDTPTQSSLAVTLIAETSHTPIFQYPFKSSSPYKAGIQFKDKYKRPIGGLFTADGLRVNVPDRDYNYTTYYNALQWTLSNVSALAEIPLEAYYYDILLTKDLRTRFFIQGKANALKYAVKNPATGVITYQDNYVAGVYALAIDASILYTDGLGYSFQEGDLATLWTSTSGVIYRTNVIGQDGNYILCAPVIINAGILLGVLSIFEVYSPYKEAVNEPYYTYGQGYPVNNPETGSRQYSQLSGALNGDVYAQDKGTYFTENMSTSTKFYKSWFGDWGQPYFVLNSRPLHKLVSIQYSETFVPGTRINGLSSFDFLNEKQVPTECGQIQKLMTTSKVENQLGVVMLAICESETCSLYLGEVQQYGSNEPSVLASAPQVIGTVNVLKGSYGTMNPESVVEFRGAVFWLDVKNGKPIQYASNGLFPLSNYKSTTFWKLFCQQYLSMTVAQIEALGGRPFIFTTVDPHHFELLFSIPKLLNTPPRGYLPDYPSTIYPFDIWDGQGKTIVYDLEATRWKGSFSFNPEWFITFGNNLYALKNGHLYIHNQTNIFCNYYGVQYTPAIMFLSNKIPTTPKVYDNISIEGNIVPNFVYFYSNTPFQQSTDLVDFSFRNLEGVLYATILRNKLIPSATGYSTTGLMTGQKVRTVALFVMIQFTVTNVPLELKFVTLGYSLSSGHTT